MARVVLDTDILSEIIKKRDATVAARATSYLSDEGRFTVSVLSVMEIVYGFHRLGREDRLEQFRTLISARPGGRARRQSESSANRRKRRLTTPNAVIAAWYPLGPAATPVRATSRRPRRGRGPDRQANRGP